MLPPINLPKVREPKKKVGPNKAALSASKPKPFKVGTRKRPILTSAPTYKNIPTTARAKTGSLSNLIEERMLGGTSALVSSTFKKATNKNANIINTKNTGNTPLQPIVAKIGSINTKPTKYDEADEPIPLIPWASAKFLLYFPFSLTSLINGLPAT